jgi:hypothetical protein
MSCYQSVWNAAAAMATLLMLGAPAPAGDILELKPGLTKIVRPGRPVQVVAIGNPNLADASVINLNSIAITGKGIGVTNLILFDDKGEEISNTTIQVVRGTAFREGNDVEERREITIESLGKATRRYLCGSNCSAMTDAPPLSSNPPSPSGTSAQGASSSPGSTLINSLVQPLAGAPPPGR